MTSPFYRQIKGKFVIIGKEPDGDSVRFIADNPKLYRSLHRADRMKPSRDGSVQLRFEGIDAPELHYGSAAQPMGREVRDRLLNMLGFKQVEYAGGESNRVVSATPETIPGAILSQSVETNGRPVSFILLEQQASKYKDGKWVEVDDNLLDKTINLQLLAQGMAYYTVYQPRREAQNPHVNDGGFARAGLLSPVT